MTTFFKVAPVEGRKVRRPDGSELPAQGDTVQRNSYWLRKIAAGDVTEIVTTSPSKKAKSA